MFGRGLLKGLSITMRHFIESYYYDRNPLRWFSLKGRYDQEWLEKRQAVDGRGIFTIQYPEQKRQITENFRFIPMLVYEETPEDPRCTACGICARVCPPQCIWIERGTDDKGRPKAQPAGFWIDATICMSCGFCAEFCPFDAIKMDHDYEIAVYERQELLFDLEKLRRPTTYHAQIHPRAWQEEQRAKAEKEAKKKADKDQAG